MARTHVCPHGNHVDIECVVDYSGVSWGNQFLRSIIYQIPDSLIFESAVSLGIDVLLLVVV